MTNLVQATRGHEAWRLRSPVTAIQCGRRPQFICSVRQAIEVENPNAVVIRLPPTWGDWVKKGGTESSASRHGAFPIQFSHSVLSNSLEPYGLQHARLPCPSSTPGVITNSRSLLKHMFIELVMPFNHLILCHLLLLPSIFPSLRVFSNESVLHIRWSKYWSFSFSITPSNEHLGLISFRMDWLDLLAA